MKFNETDLGYEIIEKNFICFFGKYNSDIQNLQRKYPYLEWASLKQIHSDRLVECKSSTLNYSESDAHWTSEKNKALITKTADCIPIVGWNKSSQTVISIHAGWRGIVNCIVTKSLITLSDHNPIHDWKIYIGPHIMKNSFQIQKDVFELLEKSTNIPSVDWSSNISGSFYVDLSTILEAQLVSVGVPLISISKCFFDTKTDLRFHSFRRDQERSGRQISFIAKI